MHRRVGQVFLAVLVLLASSTPALAEPSAVRSLEQTHATYPRAIRLQHSGPFNGRIIATTTTFTNGAGIGSLYESRDDGKTFRKIGAVKDPLAARGLCCTHLYELPQRVGKLPKGTLLWAGSVGQDERNMSLRVWQSRDRGRSWSQLTSCYDSPNGQGLWEPELFVDAAGRLVCQFADETEKPRFDQLVAQRVSVDGVTWGPKTHVVTSGNRWHRPGMPNVRRLHNGVFYMTYEICAQFGKYFCAVYYRTSNDGVNWGDPFDFGTLVESTHGRYFTHTPTIALTPQGRLLLIGQILQNADGSVAEGNGRTLFVNDNNGNGRWTEGVAPVAVPGARDNYCPNYSPTLVSSLDGKRVLEISTDYVADQSCRAFFATGPLPA
ncbi:sialidase family protein [Allokutzneria oryzae]|uniref:Sialidase family protein n=1 Tax=Allokutzneria oryzae TaxID=1378989 RepID=A0ABV6A115_9PSEU